jgi:energy-coupling factor transporter ATP-binding protein EcfA2
MSTKRLSKTMQGSGGDCYFLSLSVRNLRCFGSEEQTLNLSTPTGRAARWTLLLGENGSGKTTLLQCLAGFEVEPKQSAARFFERFRPLSDVVRAPSPLAVVKVRTGRSRAFEGEVKATTVSTFQFRSAAGEEEVGYADDLSVHAAIPRCYAYGASRRGGKSSLKEAESSDSAASLFDDDADLTNAEEWLLRLDYSSIRHPKPAGVRSRFNQVASALVRLLPGVTAIRLSEPKPPSLLPDIEFQTSDGWVRLQQLGHGYRGLIAWVVDFSSRMFARYPNSVNPLGESAVVLVDEIDLHLHPRWQRSLVGHLTELFPRTQFIVTAHSPLVVQSVGTDANIAVLRREQDGVVIDTNVEAIRGWRIDQILTSDLFGLPTARPPEFDAAIKRRTALLSQSVLSDEERTEVEELNKTIAVLPTEGSGEDAQRMMRLAEKSQELLRKYGG